MNMKTLVVAAFVAAMATGAWAADDAFDPWHNARPQYGGCKATGLLYTTWESKYDQLENFGNMVWEKGRQE